MVSNRDWGLGVREMLVKGYRCTSSGHLMNSTVIIAKNTVLRARNHQESRPKHSWLHTQHNTRQLSEVRDVFINLIVVIL